MKTFKAINLLGWVEVVSLPGCVVCNGSTIAVLSNVYNTLFWSLNPVRVVSNEKSPSIDPETKELQSQIAYSTLDGHLLEGEERFKVSMHKSSSDVVFEIVSYAKGSGLLGDMTLPLIQPLQCRFLQETVLAMEKLMRLTSE